MYQRNHIEAQEIKRRLNLMGIKFNIFKIFAVMGQVNLWAQKALADGKIDAQEAAELVAIICATLGIKAEIKL
jgi:hypothetical protein